MLNLMRKKANTWIIKFLLGAIVIVFVFWGVGSFKSRRESRVATVNGETITIEEYRNSYNTLIEQLRQRFGNSLNDDTIEMLQVKKQALDRLVDERLLLQEADKLDFRVTDAELAATISKMKAFQTNNGFDRRLYQNLLNRYRMTPEQFEQLQRRSMLIEKLRTFVTDSVKVSDLEAVEWFKSENASVDIEYALFEFGRYSDISVSEEDLTTYFDQHKETYKTRPGVKAQYLRFSSEDYMDKVQLAAEDIEDYFYSNPDEFETPKTVEARHILIKVDQNADDAEVEKARLKIQDILKKAEEGKDFAELAKQYSEGPSRANGGYLGTFKKQDMVKPFADKAFSMASGEISDPVRTRFGWHLIKVDSVNEASTQSLEDAEDKIRKKMMEDRARNFAYDAAEAVYDGFMEGDNLADTAQAQQLKSQTTDFFTRGEPVRGVSKSSEFVSAAFELSPMEISDIQDFGDGFYLIQVIEREPEKIPAFEAVKDRVRSDYVKDRQHEKAKKDAEDLLAALKAGRLMEEAGKAYDVKPALTGWFKRNEAIPKIGYEHEIAEAAFLLSTEKPLAENVIKGSKGYYAIRFHGRNEPGEEEFNKEKQNIKKKLLSEKQYNTFNNWMKQIRENSEIAIYNEDLLR